MGKMAKQVEDAGLDDKNPQSARFALIQSMTKKERANPALLQASVKNASLSRHGSVET